ncbi:WG repeat-containing protein [Gallibacterium anatis]|uniref:WG repeat-containing protein n=1 Tax=Gallibacterium anatis TaxID=750 RepID=UPI003004BC37
MFLKLLTVFSICFFVSACIDDNARNCRTLYQDKEKKSLADSYCEKSANSGNAESQNIMALILIEKNNVEQAIKLFESAANQGYSEAIFNLAQLYDKGELVQKDEKKAYFYYKQSCEKKEIRACERINTYEINKIERKDKDEIEKLRKQLEQQKQNLDIERRELEQQKEKVKEEQYLIDKANKELENQNDQMQKKYESLKKELSSYLVDTSKLKFYEDLAVFIDKNGLYGFVNRDGEVIIEPKFLYAGRFSQGRSAVKDRNQLWGFIDKTGKYVIAPQYVCVGAFSNEGLAGVYNGGYLLNGGCAGGKWGYMDIYGNWVINPVLDYAERFSKGKAKVSFQGYTGFIDRYGNWVR